MKHTHAFTLVEISIVLVIIGLIVGGVLAGQNLIRSAAVRAQLTQIEKLNIAVGTFRGKFDALPGDATQIQAAKFGFTAAITREGDPGRGDGNGVLQGNVSYTGGAVNAVCWGFNGELAWFWEDLTANSRLIEGNFNTATNSTITVNTVAEFKSYVPSAMLGENHLSVFSVDGTNYFQIALLTSATSNSATNGKVGLTVSQAYSIDKKIDDGMPVAGNIQAKVAISTVTSPLATGSNGLVTWGVGGFNSDEYMALAAPSALTCYDTTSNTYSIAQNNGNGVNCALSLKFK